MDDQEHLIEEIERRRKKRHGLFVWLFGPAIILFWFSVSFINPEIGASEYLGSLGVWIVLLLGAGLIKFSGSTNS